MINKASYRRTWRGLTLSPRWKSEWRQQSRSLFDQEERTTLMELFSLLLETQLLQATRLQAGVEYALFNDFDRDAEDFDSLSWALQLATESAYLGYRIQALAGFVVERKAFAEAKAETTTEPLSRYTPVCNSGLYLASHLTKFASWSFICDLVFYRPPTPRR